MIRPLTVVLLLMATAFAAVSCDNEFPLEDCPCHNQNNGIGGWEEGKDSTVVNNKDSVGGFEVSLDKWDNSETHDIHL